MLYRCLSSWGQCEQRKLSWLLARECLCCLHWIEEDAPSRCWCCQCYTESISRANGGLTGAPGSLDCRARFYMLESCADELPQLLISSRFQDVCQLFGLSETGRSLVFEFVRSKRTTMRKLTSGSSALFRHIW